MKYVIILVISFGVHFLNFPINDRQADDESKAKNKVLELTRFNPDASLVSPTIDGRIDKNHNVVYCSSFEIAWIAVRDRIFGGKIKLDTKIPWVKALNKRPVNKSISATYISAISGFGKDDIITKINQDLSSRFGINSSIDFPIADYDIFSFAYLKKDIAFSISLNHDSNAPGLLFNDSLEVNFMSKTGAANPKFKSTFRIHDYKNEDDFIFQIETKSEEDEVFFAKIPAGKTLRATYNTTLKRVEKGNLEFLGEFEEVKIPYINFHIEKEFKQLEGRQVLNQDFKGYGIGKAMQIIDFGLNRVGINLESQAGAEFGFGHALGKPRKFIFNKAFLIILKEKEKKEPYFLMWVNNSELMKPIR